MMDSEVPLGLRTRAVTRPQPTDEQHAVPGGEAEILTSLIGSPSLCKKTSFLSILEHALPKLPKLEEKTIGHHTFNLENLELEAELNKSDPFDESAVIPAVDESTEDPNMPIVTIRSCIVGLLMSVFGAAVSQIFVFKPVHMHLNPLFLQLACLIIGRAFYRIPGPLWWNPGPFTVKETVFSAIMATAGASGAPGVEVVAAQNLFFDRRMHPIIVIMTLLSSQFIGYGWAGLLRPFLVYPAKTAFPSILPSVALFRSLCGNDAESEAKVKSFKKTFGWASLYEVLPTYIAPALQAISPWCLTLPQVPAITNLFGGSLVAEGMGIFAFSSDWTLIGSHSPLFVPLIAQITDWASVAFSIFLMGAAYRFNWFGGPHLPFISYDLLDSRGKRYNLSIAVHQNGTENIAGVELLGLPYYPITYVVGKAGISLAVTSALTTAVFYNWEELRAVFFKGQNKGMEDPHRTITKKYSEFPDWAFVMLAVLFLALAFLSAFLGESGLSFGALLTAFGISAVLSLASGFFYATVGIRLHTDIVVQMLGGLLFPGNAIGNMWFTLFGSTSVVQSVFMLRDLKLGQYMHLSSLSVVFAQLIGTLVGGITHYVVMIAILSTQREVLLLPHGNGVFTGMMLSSAAANATTWGLFSRKLYLPGQRYAVLPFCLLIGFFLPVPFFLLHRWRPNCGFNKINVSLFCSSIFHSVSGVTSGRTVATFLGIYTQYYLRKYQFKWYQKYNYILNAALDGGTQLTMFILTFALQGGAGFNVQMPTYFLNPKGTRDYCYLPKAYN